MLCEQDIALLDAVRAILPGSGFTQVHSAVAAAYDSAGVIFTGVNVEHRAGGACAELAVVGAAAAALPARPPLVTMVTAQRRGVAEPCLSCCRTLRDLYPDLRIIVPVLVQIGRPLEPGVGFQATPVDRVLLGQERLAADRLPARPAGE